MEVRPPLQIALCLTVILAVAAVVVPRVQQVMATHGLRDAQKVVRTLSLPAAEVRPCTTGDPPALRCWSSPRQPRDLVAALHAGLADVDVRDLRRWCDKPMRNAPHVCSVMGTKAGVLVFAHAFPRLVRSGQDTMAFNGSDVYVSVDRP